MTQDINNRGEQKDWNDELEALRKQFIVRLSTRMDAIHTAVEIEQLDKVAWLAHSLSGAAGSYGIPELAKKSRELESAAKLNDNAAARKYFETLKGLVINLKTQKLTPLLH